MRTYLATVERPGMAPARYRVAFHDHGNRTMAVMRLRDGQSAIPVAIHMPQAAAAIRVALAQIAPPHPPSAPWKPAKTEIARHLETYHV